MQQAERFTIGLVALAALSGGCDSSHQPANPLPPRVSSIGPRQGRTFIRHERTWVSVDVILEFKVVDQHSRRSKVLQSPSPTHIMGIAALICRRRPTWVPYGCLIQGDMIRTTNFRLNPGSWPISGLM